MSAKTVRVVVDPELCMGSGTCITVAPGFFDIGEDGFAEPLRPVSEANEQLSKAVSRCPMAAISVTEQPD
ncbi:MAG: ferredoxin [Mycobacterium sp.]|nr:ferredoxin [Mycobacterium sp.]